MNSSVKAVPHVGEAKPPAMAHDAKELAGQAVLPVGKALLPVAAPVVMKALGNSWQRHYEEPGKLATVPGQRSHVQQQHLGTTFPGQSSHVQRQHLGTTVPGQSSHVQRQHLRTGVGSSEAKVLSTSNDFGWDLVLPKIHNWSWASPA